MFVFVIFDPTKPYVVLDSAETLEGIADALMARSTPSLTVCINGDGHTRDLNPDEQRELDALLNASH